MSHRAEGGAWGLRGSQSRFVLGREFGWKECRYFRSFSPFSRSVRQPLLKSEYLRIIADRFSITEEVAEAQLLHEKRGRPESGRRPFRSVQLLETAANRISGGKGPEAHDQVPGPGRVRARVRCAWLFRGIKAVLQWPGCFARQAFAARKSLARLLYTICCGNRICRNSIRDIFWNPMNSKSRKFNCGIGLRL